MEAIEEHIHQKNDEVNSPASSAVTFDLSWAIAPIAADKLNTAWKLEPEAPQPCAL
jgi:hypothetical protein